MSAADKLRAQVGIQHVYTVPNFIGHERFGGLTRVYYKYAHGALIVFDLSRPETFESALSWLTDITEKVEM